MSAWRRASRRPRVSGERDRDEHEVRLREKSVQAIGGVHLVGGIERAAVPGHAEHPHPERPAAPATAAPMLPVPITSSVFPAIGVE